MSIRIIEDEPEIVLTRSEHARLQREWQASQQMTVMPQDFETWLRGGRTPSTLSVFGAPPWIAAAQAKPEDEGMRVWG